MEWEASLREDTRFQGSLVVGLQASQDHMCFIFPLQSWAAGQESHALGGNQNQDVGPSRALALKLSTSSLTLSASAGSGKGRFEQVTEVCSGGGRRENRKKKKRDRCTTGKRRKTEETRWALSGGADRGGDTTILKAALHLPVSNGLLLS